MGMLLLAISTSFGSCDSRLVLSRDVAVGRETAENDSSSMT
jgi:hypothetical protein